MATESTVFLVDDDQAVRDSIRFLMKSVGLDLACFANAQDFLEAYDETAPGCLVLDVRIPGMSGIDLMERLNRMGSRLPVIIISGHADVPIAVQAMKFGAVDVLEKPFKDQVLLDRIHAAFEKNRQAIQDSTEKAGIQGRMGLLTPREGEVLDYMMEGIPPKEIARKMGIAAKTLGIHRGRVLEKLGAKSLPDLVRMVFIARR